jgi:hypothetical protein
MWAVNQPLPPKPLCDLQWSHRCHNSQNPAWIHWENYFFGGSS